MREIKFRGKEEYSGEWVYGYYCRGSWIDPVNGVETPRHIIHAEYLFDIDPDTLGQYTGLKDKNGKEIYEGDIICFVNGQKKVNGEWVDNKFIYTIEYSEGAFRGVLCLSKALGAVEVIGNIHDNQDLLNKK